MSLAGCRMCRARHSRESSSPRKAGGEAPPIVGGSCHSSTPKPGRSAAGAVSREAAQPSWQRSRAGVTLTDMRLSKADSATWTAREDAVVEIVSPEVAATKLGRAVAAILNRRRELGLPQREAGNEKTRRGAPRPWTTAEDALVCKLSPLEVAKRTGRTIGAAKTRRTKLFKVTGTGKSLRNSRRPK